MNVNHLTSLHSGTTQLNTAYASKNPAFKTFLDKHTKPTTEQLAPPPSRQRKEAEEAAAGLVSNALILPILKQLRRSPFNTEGPFSPGTGEKTFGPQFDMQLADRIAHSPRLGIKNALADRLMKKSSPAKAPAPLKGLNTRG